MFNKNKNKNKILALEVQVTALEKSLYQSLDNATEYANQVLDLKTKLAESQARTEKEYQAKLMFAEGVEEMEEELRQLDNLLVVLDAKLLDSAHDFAEEMARRQELERANEVLLRAIERRERIIEATNPRSIAAAKKRLELDD